MILTRMGVMEEVRNGQILDVIENTVNSSFW